MEEENKELSKEELLELMDLMITKFEEMPTPAMYLHCTQHDLYSLVILIRELFRRYP